MRSASPGGGGAGGAAAEGGDDSGSRGYTALNVPNTYLSESSVEQVKDLLTARAVRTVLVYMTEFHDGTCRAWMGGVCGGRGGWAGRTTARRRDCR